MVEKERQFRALVGGADAISSTGPVLLALEDTRWGAPGGSKNNCCRWVVSGPRP